MNISRIKLYQEKILDLIDLRLNIIEARNGETNGNLNLDERTIEVSGGRQLGYTFLLCLMASKFGFGNCIFIVQNNRILDHIKHELKSIYKHEYIYRDLNLVRYSKDIRFTDMSKGKCILIDTACMENSPGTKKFLEIELKICNPKVILMLG